MTKEQLLNLTVDLNISIPKSSPRTRKSLVDIVSNHYRRWEYALDRDKISLSSLKKIFEEKCGPSDNLIRIKCQIRKRIQISVPGDEIMYMWLTTNREGFVPVLFRIPGSTIHKNRITSWLHDCGLLHASSLEDKRPTR